MHKLSLLSLALLLLATGCSNSNKSVDMGGEDGSKVALLIEDLNETKHNSKKVVDSFVSKQVTPDVKKLNQLTFYVLGKPVVNGTMATCQVQIEKSDSTSLGEKEWQFEKVGDQWKIKAAPLP